MGKRGIPSTRRFDKGTNKKGIGDIMIKGIHAKIVLKTAPFKRYMNMRKEQGAEEFENFSKLADFIAYTRGYVSQIVHDALEEPEKYPTVPVSDGVTATIMYLTNTHFEEFFDIEPNPEYDPKAKYKKFQERP